MADEIIDLTRYLKREPASGLPRGTMSLWGADDGGRARLALPLWRLISLAGAERAVISWADVARQNDLTPFVVLDVAADPARLNVDLDRIPVPRFRSEEGPSLVDLTDRGLVVYLGSRAGRIWTLVIDGGPDREALLKPSAREEILFLAGECAGLLFLTDLAEDGFGR